MFEGLRGRTQGVVDVDYRREYNEPVEVAETNEEEDNLDYQICIKVRDDEYYVDDCKENWDILNNLNNEISCFIYLKDSSEREDGILGIRVSEIVAFYLEED
jgi:hypothetical protein